jgi:hypothetical protein
MASCVDDSPLFHQGSSADRASAFLTSLHAMPVSMWTREDKQMRLSAMIAVQWQRKKRLLARFDSTVG